MESEEIPRLILTPQGAILSLLPSNIYLHEINRLLRAGINYFGLDFIKDFVKEVEG